MPTFRVRLRNVRPKSATIHLLPDGQDRRAEIEALVAEAFEAFAAAGLAFSGFAFVLWDRRAENSTAVLGAGNLPDILVPDFVRLRLASEVSSEFAEGRRD